MRKSLALAATAVFMLAVAAVAVAQTVERSNVYTVIGDTNPNKAGKTSKPVPVSVGFDYLINEANNLRPAPVERYVIQFEGLRTNTNNFPGCRAGTISSQQTPNTDDCPPRSIVGTGTLVANVGGETVQSDTSNVCYSDIEVVNSRNNKATLLIAGSSSDSKTVTFGDGQSTNAKCPNAAGIIPANFVNRRNGSELNFNVPLNPFRSLNSSVEVSVRRVESTIKKLTTKAKPKGEKRRRTVGFFEAVGKCQGGTRDVTVAFTNEDGNKQTQSDEVSC